MGDVVSWVANNPIFAVVVIAGIFLFWVFVISREK